VSSSPPAVDVRGLAKDQACERRGRRVVKLALVISAARACPAESFEATAVCKHLAAANQNSILSLSQRSEAISFFFLESLTMCSFAIFLITKLNHQLCNEMVKSKVQHALLHLCV
jgi:hypothetical protein